MITGACLLFWVFMAIAAESAREMRVAHTFLGIFVWMAIVDLIEWRRNK